MISTTNSAPFFPDGSPAPRRTAQGATEPRAASGARLSEAYRAVILDLDGVLTQTADLHARAWKRTFDPFLARRGRPPFDLEHDYRTYVDGKPRYEGVHSFLRSRGLDLPWGEDSDPYEADTVRGLGNRKNELFQQLLQEEGATVFEDARRKLRKWRDAGLKLAVVSSSRNCAAVLASAGLSDQFDVRVDSATASTRNLSGKPAPDYFLEAARQLGVAPSQAVVIEDAVAGVQAARRGGFGLVVALNRGAPNAALLAEMPDLLIDSLDELDSGPGDSSPAESPPLVLEEWERFSQLVGFCKLALFLDYDGCLTPIVDNPDAAVLSPSMRSTLSALAEKCVVSVVSGRELIDVEQRIGLHTLRYAGSHGFDIRGPDGLRLEHPAGHRAIPHLDRAEQLLREALGGVPGVLLERKHFALAVHYRQTPPEEVPRVRSAVEQTISTVSELRLGHGKMVFELRPDVDWDKGRAVLWLMEKLGLTDETWLPLYIGDDATDEDAFRALRDRGIGLLVSDTDRPTLARWRLKDPDEVQRFLDLLTNLLDDRARA